MDFSPIFQSKRAQSMMFRSMHETSRFESRRFLPEQSSSESGWNEITIADIEKFKANNGDSNRFFFNQGIGARVVGGQEAEPHRYVLLSIIYES